MNEITPELIAELREKLKEPGKWHFNKTVLIALLDEIERLEAVHWWIPVSARLPGAFDRIILLTNDTAVGEGFFNPYHDEHRWYWVDKYKAFGITHWRPMPPPPESEE